MNKKRIAHITDRHDKARLLFDESCRVFSAYGVPFKSSLPSLHIETDNEIHSFVPIGGDEDCTRKLAGLQFNKVFVDEAATLSGYTREFVKSRERWVNE